MGLCLKLLFLAKIVEVTACAVDFASETSKIALAWLSWHPPNWKAQVFGEICPRRRPGERKHMYVCACEKCQRVYTKTYLGTTALLMKGFFKKIYHVFKFIVRQLWLIFLEPNLSILKNAFKKCSLQQNWKPYNFAFTSSSRSILYCTAFSNSSSSGFLYRIYDVGTGLLGAS